MEVQPLLRFRILGVVLVILVFRVADSQPSDDGGVMADLKKGLVLPKGLWKESDYCSWDGVQCDRNRRVVRIQLKNHLPVITGELPSNFSNLTELTYLELRQTNIAGPLPTLKGLSSLAGILISGNNFTSIPSDFFDGLTMLESVTMDKLTQLAPWQIPDSLRSCSSLSAFSATSANIIGKIPEFINGSVFPNLVTLRLSYNSIEGGLPPSLGSLTTLQTLMVNNQNQKSLNGTIEVIGSMKSLTEIWLNMNSFTGPIPDFSDFYGLQMLNLRDNEFTGPVPSSLTTLKSLTEVRLSNNFLQGPVPVFDKSVKVDMQDGANSFCLDAPGNCSDDVTLLLSIVKNFGYPLAFAKDWKGNDPCNNWQGILCAQGKITGTNFQNRGLTGTISPNFSLISSLQSLILANNNLYGTIPMELTKLTELKVVDLSNNRLSGDVPPFKNVNVKIDNNPDIGKNKPVPPSPGAPSGGSHNPPPGGETGGNPGVSPSGGMDKKSPFPVGVVAGVIVGVCVIFAIGLITFCLCKKKHKSGKDLKPPVVIHPHRSDSGPDMVKITVAGPNVNVIAGSESCGRSSGGTSDIHVAEAGNMVISIQVLREVTDNFSKDRILGRGGFATVYRGDLHDGTKIAVKRMEAGVMDSNGLNEFKSEIDILNKVRHRHLVSLIGYCLDGNERILVYEYMPQGTLSRYLFNWEFEDLKPLDWARRLSIALDVGRGVEYLHGLASQSFIHRDLKPSNILLGDDMKAKVADFGLVRLAPEGKNSIETRLAGTFGYLAPEYAATGRVTTKVDIFAFGVILMELITGRKALDERLAEENVHLVTWFRRMRVNKDTFHKAIDTTIEPDEETFASISTVSDLAGYCCSSDPQQRPDMGHVVNVLSSLVDCWKPSETDPDEKYTETNLSLSETLEKWGVRRGATGDGYTSSYIESTQSSEGGNLGIFPSVSGR